MPLVLKHNRTNTQAACPEGLYDAVCCDVIDLGTNPTSYGDKHQVQILWELTTDEGVTYHLSKRYTASLHEKAKLAQDIKAWRGGVELTADDLRAGFDLEQLIGKSCQLLVTHFEREGTAYASVDKILKPKKKIALTGRYDSQMTRDRIMERLAMQAANASAAMAKEAFRAPVPAPAAGRAAPSLVAGVKAQDKVATAIEPDELPF